MRPVTWLLRRPTAHFRQVLTWLSENEPRLLRELLTAVTEEGLNEKHVEGGRLLEAAVKSMGGVKGGHASLLSSTIDLTDSNTGPNKAGEPVDLRLSDEKSRDEIVSRSRDCI